MILFMSSGDEGKSEDVEPVTPPLITNAPPITYGTSDYSEPPKPLAPRGAKPPSMVKFFLGIVLTVLMAGEVIYCLMNLNEGVAGPPGVLLIALPFLLFAVAAALMTWNNRPRKNAP